jgi:hypothetical protein
MLPFCSPLVISTVIPQPVPDNPPDFCGVLHFASLSLTHTLASQADSPHLFGITEFRPSRAFALNPKFPPLIPSIVSPVAGPLTVKWRLITSAGRAL